MDCSDYFRDRPKSSRLRPLLLGFVVLPKSARIFIHLLLLQLRKSEIFLQLGQFQNFLPKKDITSRRRLPSCQADENNLTKIPPNDLEIFGEDGHELKDTAHVSYFCFFVHFVHQFVCFSKSITSKASTNLKNLKMCPAFLRLFLGYLEKYRGFRERISHFVLLSGKSCCFFF